MTTARPAPGARLFLLDDSGLLFIEPRQELHALNTSATAIWCLMEEGLDAAEIGRALGAMAGLSANEASSFVDAALADWAARGFLADERPPAPEAKVVTPTVVGTLHSEPVFVSSRHYALGALRFSVRFTALEQEAVVHPILAHLAAEAAQGAATIDVAMTPGKGSLTLLRDGAAVATCEALDELAPVLKSLVWQAGLDAQDFLLDIHAGLVAGPAGCIMMPAPPGSGKSTLTAALVHAGLDFFSDEVALLVDEGLDAIPFPLALCVKDTGLDVIAQMFPQIRNLPLHRRGDGKRVAYLPPPANRIPVHEARRPVAALVFPRYAPGTACNFKPLDKAEAAARLFAQCLGVAGRLSSARVGQLVQWLRRVPCHELVFADLQAAVEAVLGIAYANKAL